MATKLDVQYRNSVHQVRSKLESFAVRQWNGLGSWRDDDYERLVKTLVPRIDAGQQQIANLTDAYIRRLAVAEFGSIRAGVVVDASTEALRGVPAMEVYHRPFASAYTELKDGKSMTTALAAGRDRLSDLVLSGSQLAKTHAARDALGRSRFLGFQRVLTGRENCALCVVASTQRYTIGDLLPIHPGCDCDCKPLHGKFDVQVIKPELLESTYDTIAGKLEHVEVWRDARDLGLGKVDAKNRPISDFTDLIMSREHGELGPVLTWRSDKFTSVADIAALA